MKKTKNTFFNLFEAEDLTENTNNTDNTVSAENNDNSVGGQFSFFENENAFGKLSSDCTDNAVIPDGTENTDTLSTETFEFKDNTSCENNSNTDNSNGSNIFDKHLNSDNTTSANNICLNGSIDKENVAGIENVQKNKFRKKSLKNTDIEFSDKTPDSNNFSVEVNVYKPSNTDNVNITENTNNADNADNSDMQNGIFSENTLPEDDISESINKTHFLKDDGAAEKMVSILEEDVSSEITEDVFCEFPEKCAHTPESQPVNTENLKTYKEIRKLNTSDKFETPYIYTSKNGDRIRYRLALPSDRNPRKMRRIKDVLGMIATLIIAFTVAMLLRSFVFVFATVDGPSMQPTLQTGEKIFVTRYTYYFSEIERGDIVVCDYPSEMYPNHYVKRVIALGGERVRIEGGTVYINDEPLTEDYILSTPREDMAEVTVPEGSVFVMGDNRNNSTDSRKSYIGAISKKLIIGKARCIIYPFSEIRSLESEQ